MSSDHVAGGEGSAWSSALRSTSSGVLFLAAAGGCTVLAAGAASAVLLRTFDAVHTRRHAAVERTAGYVTSAVVLGSVGMQQLRRARGHLATSGR